ncbi:DUF3444 domain-containing protein [Caenorhabditis elegans]|uniref:DUF3444 domain-containing protein n=1 Tax=Caenorhabditis elegans TaxID=6239 RepID=Q17705_CAEEL|nr:DUF3444 domain-containing protein [Caenorhabditis elegans]CAB01116.1 DUF3444 domain-containing protein [Caenorhabditis elegans]|eukprot:NP_506450.1 Uncharacterized protein CELE_C06B3.6 [Caenorhabditis elegans]
MKRDAKDHARNRLMNFYIKKAPTYSAIVKIEHFENDAPSEAKDFEPLVVYSLNKKKRWEINQEFLDSSSEGDDSKSVIIDREIPDLYFAWWSLGNVHSHDCVNHSKPVNSSQIDNAKKEEKVVGYHIVRVPKNHKKVFDNKCIRYIGLRYPEFLGYSSKDWPALQYEMKELEEEHEELEKENASLEAESTETTKPTGFYNLDEHFVAKKQRKPKGWLTVE